MVDISFLVAMLVCIGLPFASEFGLTRRWPILRWPVVVLGFAAVAFLFARLTNYLPGVSGPKWLEVALLGALGATAIFMFVHYLRRAPGDLSA